MPPTSDRKASPRPASGGGSTPRVIAYHQARGSGDGHVPLRPMVERGLTHLVLATVHITDDGAIFLNDHEHTDPHHQRLWTEVAEVQRAGLRVLAMVGGWAPGTTDKLDTDTFDRYYGGLRDFLRVHHFDGIDIDVEQDMSLEGVVALIDALRRDFGEEFTIILAPVASAMWGGANLSGFDYEDLYRQRGERIDFVNVQFYSGFGSAATTEDYERIVARGIWPVHKLVLGIVGNPLDANGFVEIDTVCRVLAQLVAKHPDFGGVDVWEYFRALPGGADAPWEWIDRMREGLGLPVLDRALAPVTPASSTAPLGLVPTPQKLTTRAGHVVLPHRLHGSGPHEWLDVVERVAGPGSGLRISPVEAAPADDAPAGGGAVEAPRLSVARDQSLAEGAYRLVADEAGVAIRAAGHAGLVNAVATLRQLLPPWACGLAPLPGQDLVVPFVEIEDAPRFSWRGMHLDVGRHFQPLASLFRLVDLLSLHKLNYLHLHLTEDQGWRFEVKKYPLLTELGAVRPHTRAPHWKSDDGTPHGGFYTQDQLRSLVAYAAERGITVVPEVDVPGHVRALLHAYPEFGEDPDGAGFAVATTFGVFDEVLHLTDHTVAMVEDVFTELLDVFPSEFIHIGGDECPKVQWQRSEEAARLAQERGLDGVELLQRWLTSHLRDWLSARGRRLVGWDEIIEEAEMPGAVVMSWRGTEPGIKALAQGNEVVMAPGQTTYFDHYQSKQDEEPYAIGGHLPWETVLAYDPTAGVPQAHLPRLRGVQAQLWTEYMPDAEHVQYMAFPRTAALAEVAWNATPADADEFRQRLRTHLQRLDASGVNYRPVDGPHPWQAGGTGHRGRPEGHAQEE